MANPTEVRLILPIQYLEGLHDKVGKPGKTYWVDATLPMPPHPGMEIEWPVTSDRALVVEKVKVYAGRRTSIRTHNYIQVKLEPLQTHNPETGEELVSAGWNLVNVKETP